MTTQTKKEQVNLPEVKVTFSELFVIKYFDGLANYWSGSGNYTTNINEARLYKTAGHAQLIADSLLATKPQVVPVQIQEI